MSSSSEQPLKKRKIYDYTPPPPQPPSSTTDSCLASPPQPPVAALSTPLPSEEEIARKRVNRDEIKKLLECYKTIKYCVANKDPRLTPELEQAYLDLITKSRGCLSVQRILSELIPRYARYCPTALEAAAKVSINMYNWSLAIIMRGEDADGVAYQTAKACIFALVDLCCIASEEKPVSSVIRGICSAVFQNVLTFLTSSFEGKDICHHVGSEEIKQLQQPLESFNDLKQEPVKFDDSVTSKLLKFRVLSLLRIFFSFPKNLFATCFELLLPGTELHMQEGGKYFLTQVTRILSMNYETHAMNEPICGQKVYKSSDFTSSKCDESRSLDSTSDGNGHPENSGLLPDNCFLGMVVRTNPSLKDWIILKYKCMCKSLIPRDASDTCSFLKNIFGPFLELDREVCFEDTDDVDCSPSRSIKYSDLVQKVSSELNKEANAINGIPTLGLPDTSKVAGNENRCASSGQLDFEMPDTGMEPFPNKFGAANEGSGMHPPITTSGLQSNLRSDGTEESSSLKIEKTCGLSGMATSKQAFGVSSSGLLSPGKDLAARNETRSKQIVWYVDGDPLALDVCPASKQLWLGLLGCDTSEISVRLRFEEFGPLEKFLFYPSKGFALVEYRNIMDAIRAHEHVKVSHPWGSCVYVKFLDVSLGSRGAVDGVALGESCHVYIGRVPSKWAKDEILNVLQAHLLNIRTVTDFTNENSLLLEFGTAKEAAVAMSHIRKRRKENGFHKAFTKIPGSCMNDNNRNLEVNSHQEAKFVHHKSNTSVHFKSDITTTGENRPGNQCAIALISRLDGNVSDHRSSNVNIEVGPQFHSANAFQPKWRATSSTPMQDAGSLGTRNADNGNDATNVRVGEQNWHYKEQELVSHLVAQRTQPCPVTAHCPSVPTPPIRAPCFPPPNYPTQNNAWNSRPMNPSFNINQVSPRILPNESHRANARPTLPFIPSSVTPLSQLQGGSAPGFDQMVRPPSLPAISPPPRLPPDFAPPLPLSPPLPPSQPPSVPPPPMSPPPLLQPAQEKSSVKKGEACLQYHWKGTLAKSGVLYCTLYARKENSSLCKYPNALSEPTDWPSRLDVTKRTDIEHVKTTFSSTPSHKREVCRLLPSSTNDQKGLFDFASYLRQKECAGVIKIPAGKSLWPRLLFILPPSVDTCSMLSIAPNPSDCLIALVLPKETNTDTA